MAFNCGIGIDSGHQLRNDGSPPFVRLSTSGRHRRCIMYITSSRSYQQILLTVLKVICVVSIFLAPIALLQVISASKQDGIKREVQDGIVHPSIIEPQVSGSEFQTADPNIGQLGELFDVSHTHKNGLDGKSILRLKRQTNDESGPSLAQLTAAGTAAGIMLGDQVAAARIATPEANYNPELSAATDEDDEQSDVDEPTTQNVDLSTLQSLKQPAGGFNQVALGEQQPDQMDNINPDQMPDSMDSLMRSEQEDMGAGQSESEQPSASSQVSNDQESLGEDDGDDIERDDSYQHPLPATAADAPGSHMPIVGQTSDLPQAGPNFMAGAIFPNTVSSPIIDSSEDLSAAAGHHYKKKKKVKKIIIKKKKKGKKYRKVKIVKYKKKKIVKKKKPKKHHHDHHYDQGKYYL